MIMIMIEIVGQPYYYLVITGEPMRILHQQAGRQLVGWSISKILLKKSVAIF